MAVYVSDVASETARLSCLEFGAYRRIIYDYFKNGAPPDDDRILQRITGLSPSEWDQVRPAVIRFFQIRGDVWVHEATETELAKANTLTAKRRKAANARWGRQSTEKINGNAYAYPPAYAHGHAQDPNVHMTITDTVRKKTSPASESLTGDSSTVSVRAINPEDLYDGDEFSRKLWRC